MAAQKCPKFSLKSCFQSLFCIPWISSLCPSSLPETVDVAIIGGGLSGLTAADTLLTAGKSVLVLEARDYVGGKVLNRPLKNGGVTEVGAEFVGPTQDKVLNMIEELGLETFDVYDEGNYILWRNGKRKIFGKNPWIDNLPPLSWLSIVNIGIIQLRINSLAAQINVSAPWSHPKAVQWDSISFDTWLHQWARFADARFLMDVFARSVWGAEPREMSLLYVLHYTAGAGNETAKGTMDRMIGVKNGAQEKRVVGGTGLIPERLAERVGWQNVILNAPIKRILKGDDDYHVVWTGGNVRADKVIIAVPPPLIPYIAFEPELPESRKRLNEGMKMGAMGKAIAIYAEPFWREFDNLNAQVFTDEGTVGLTFDNSPEDASFGAVIGFFQGDDMRHVDLMTPEEVKIAVLQEFTRYFGGKAMNVTDFVMQRWNLEEHLEGGPTAFAPPGVLAAHGPALREVVGGIHFAGTETSEYWPGYMDGAIRSGYRAAREILEQV